MAFWNPSNAPSDVLIAAQTWIERCLINDGSIFMDGAELWTEDRIEKVCEAFVEHPLSGPDRFIDKLTRQMMNSAADVQQLMAEMLWVILLFPSNLKPETKRNQITRIWNLPGTSPSIGAPLSDLTLQGIGSGGPGYMAYRPYELEYLLTLTTHLKSSSPDRRITLFNDYSAFIEWIESVPRHGDRQFRHMLRYFAFPDRVERISSNNDRVRILEAFGQAENGNIYQHSDAQLDDALCSLRQQLQKAYPGEALDFYTAPLRDRWLPDRQVNTGLGIVPVSVPGAGEAEMSETSVPPSAGNTSGQDVRSSLRVQAKLAQIGNAFGYKIWIPANDRQAVRSLLTEEDGRAILDGALPVSYDINTLDTVKQIDVIWMHGRAIVRAFEVEHTTSIYSGLLRMADLLALQPNINIRLHIVADEDRKDDVKRQLLRPVFSLLAAGPLAASCTFLSYDAVEHLASNPQLRFLRHEYIDSLVERAV